MKVIVKLKVPTEPTTEDLKPYEYVNFNVAEVQLHTSNGMFVCTLGQIDLYWHSANGIVMRKFTLSPEMNINRPISTRTSWPVDSDWSFFMGRVQQFCIPAEVAALSTYIVPFGGTETLLMR